MIDNMLIALAMGSLLYIHPAAEVHVQMEAAAVQQQQEETELETDAHVTEGT
jgi:hypothetical protein